MAAVRQSDESRTTEIARALERPAVTKCLQILFKLESSPMVFAPGVFNYAGVEITFSVAKFLSSSYAVDRRSVEHISFDDIKTDVARLAGVFIEQAQTVLLDGARNLKECLVDAILSIKMENYSPTGERPGSPVSPLDQPLMSGPRLPAAININFNDKEFLLLALLAEYQRQLHQQANTYEDQRELFTLGALWHFLPIVITQIKDFGEENIGLTTQHLMEQFVRSPIFSDWLQHVRVVCHEWNEHVKLARQVASPVASTRDLPRENSLDDVLLTPTPEPQQKETAVGVVAQPHSYRRPMHISYKPRCSPCVPWGISVGLTLVAAVVITAVDSSRHWFTASPAHAAIAAIACVASAVLLGCVFTKIASRCQSRTRFINNGLPTTANTTANLWSQRYLNFFIDHPNENELLLKRLALEVPGSPYWQTQIGLAQHQMPSPQVWRSAAPQATPPAGGTRSPVPV